MLQTCATPSAPNCANTDPQAQTHPEDARRHAGRRAAGGHCLRRQSGVAPALQPEPVPRTDVHQARAAGPDVVDLAGLNLLPCWWCLSLASRSRVANRRPLHAAIGSGPWRAASARAAAPRRVRVRRRVRARSSSRSAPLATLRSSTQGWPSSRSTSSRSTTSRRVCRPASADRADLASSGHRPGECCCHSPGR